MGNGNVVGGGSGWPDAEVNGRSYQHLFRIAITVADRLLNDCDRAFLEYLYDSPSHMDYLSRISKANRISYMTTKRCADKLAKNDLVRSCENSRSFVYYRLTEVGRMLVETSRRSGPDPDP